MGKNVLLKTETDKKTKSGLYIGDPERNKAKVEAVGQEVKSVKKGDLVIFRRINIEEITGTDKFIVDQEDILAVVD